MTTIYGGFGNDTFTDGPADGSGDVLLGLGGDDTITGGHNSSSLAGGNGTGPDTLYGGSDNDRVQFEGPHDNNRL